MSSVFTSSTNNKVSRNSTGISKIPECIPRVEGSHWKQHRRQRRELVIFGNDSKTFFYPDIASITRPNGTRHEVYIIHTPTQNKYIR